MTALMVEILPAFCFHAEKMKAFFDVCKKNFSPISSTCFLDLDGGERRNSGRRVQR